MCEYSRYFVFLSGSHRITKEIFQSRHILAGRTFQWNNEQGSFVKESEADEQSEWGREENIPTVSWGKHLHNVGLLSYHIAPFCSCSLSFTLDTLCASTPSEIALLSGRAPPISVLPGRELFVHVKEGEAQPGDVRLLILRGEKREWGQPAWHCTCTIRPFTGDRNLSTALAVPATTKQNCISVRKVEPVYGPGLSYILTFLQGEKKNTHLNPLIQTDMFLQLRPPDTRPGSWLCCLVRRRSRTGHSADMVSSDREYSVPDREKKPPTFT